MHTVSLFAAKTHLSRIVEELSSGVEKEVIISRHGKPMVRVVAIRPRDVTSRIGLAKGQFVVPDDIDAANPEIARLFAAEGKAPYAPAP
jgi:antitoxin (DNA-binding transcriptional repressor) of toxin-antitoxin stability system